MQEEGLSQRLRPYRTGCSTTRAPCSASCAACPSTSRLDVPRPELLPGPPRDGGPAPAHVSGGAHLARRLLDGRRGVLPGHPAEEEGLYDRCRIYATDMNERRAEPRPRRASSRCAAMRENTAQLHRGGGQAGLRAASTPTRDDARRPRPVLRRNIVFAQHNLATDGSFNEFNLVLCRNVLIYFNRTLQDRVHRLLYQSLVRFGFLGLGTKETVRFTPHEAALRGAAASGSIARWRDVSAHRSEVASEPAARSRRRAAGRPAGQHPPRRRPAGQAAGAGVDPGRPRARTWCAPTPDARPCAPSCSRTSRSSCST